MKYTVFWVLTVGCHAIGLCVVSVRCVWPYRLDGGTVLSLSIGCHDTFPGKKPNVFLLICFKRTHILYLNEPISLADTWIHTSLSTNKLMLQQDETIQI